MISLRKCSINIWKCWKWQGDPTSEKGGGTEKPVAVQREDPGRATDAAVLFLLPQYPPLNELVGDPPHGDDAHTGGLGSLGTGHFTGGTDGIEHETGVILAHQDLIYLSSCNQNKRLPIY